MIACFLIRSFPVFLIYLFYTSISKSISAAAVLRQRLLNITLKNPSRSGSASYGNRPRFNIFHQSVLLQNRVKFFRIGGIHIAERQTAAAHIVPHSAHRLLDGNRIDIEKQRFDQIQIFQLKAVAETAVSVKIGTADLMRLFRQYIR